MARKTVLLAGLLIAAMMPFSQPWAQPEASEAEKPLQVAEAARNRTTAASEGELANAERVNNWTVGVAGGLLEGTFIRFASELAKVLDDGDNLRVVPLVTYGAVENVSDLLYLKGVDVAITDADVFEEYKKTRRFNNIDKRVQYISEMYNAEFHLLVRSDIKSIKDLEGKKVGFNTKGSAANLTGKIVFARLGVKVEPVFVNNAIGLEKMKAGELAGIVHVVGKPNTLFTKAPSDQGFHFLPIAYDDKFADYYLPASITSGDYPGLIKQNERVDTIAVPVVLAVYNWQPGSDRFRRVERFIQYYFARFDALRKPPYHPKWQEINLAAEVPGWTRYWVADNLLKQKRTSAPVASQTTSSTESSGDLGPEDKRLFKEFLEWKKKYKK